MLNTNKDIPIAVVYNCLMLLDDAWLGHKLEGEVASQASVDTSQAVHKVLMPEHILVVAEDKPVVPIQLELMAVLDRVSVYYLQFNNRL